MWFHWWGLEHVCCSVRQAFRQTQSCSDGKVEFCFLRNHGKKKNTPSVFQRQNRKISKGYPKAKTKPNSHANTPLKCLVLKSLNKRCPVPLHGSANPEPLRLGRWQSLEQKSSPSYRVHGQKKSGTKRPLPKHELTSFALPWNYAKKSSSTPVQYNYILLQISTNIGIQIIKSNKLTSNYTYHL